MPIGIVVTGFADSYEVDWEQKKREILNNQIRVARVAQINLKNLKREWAN
jgi:hypothetical protein